VPGGEGAERPREAREHIVAEKCACGPIDSEICRPNDASSIAKAALALLSEPSLSMGFQWANRLSRRTAQG
jgi:hypothetical protein